MSQVSWPMTVAYVLLEDKGARCRVANAFQGEMPARSARSVSVAAGRHSSARAALNYQHATSERDREIAEALGVLVQKRRGDG